MAFGKDRLRPGANRVEISGGPDFYYFAGLDYYARRANFEASAGEAIRLERRYFRLARTPDNRYRIAGELAAEAVRGETVLVRITVKPKRAIDYFMLEESLPSGFQFIDERDPNLVEGVNLKNYSAHELYPGRAVFFSHYLPLEGGVVSYLAVPTIAGDLKALPAYGNSMYYPEIAGHSASSRLRVVAK
jgi:uncharacterized protein YfaS (alpha-2-macroglobulin family)